MESEHLQRESLIPLPHWLGVRVNGTTLRPIHRAMLVAALIGLFASVYLLITYVTGKPIACGLLSGCEIVRASKWAYTFNLPRPFLGVVFYLAIISFLTFHAYAPHVRPRMWRLFLLLASTLGFIESAFLTLVQWIDIRAFCTWCVTSAAAATAIFILSIFDGREPPARGAIVRELTFIFYALAFAIVIGAVALWFLLGNVAAGRHA